MSAKPFRATLTWVFVAKDMEEAEIAYGSVEDWMERGGGHMQVGSVEAMDADDVVPGSPLADDLASEGQA